MRWFVIVVSILKAGINIIMKLSEADTVAALHFLIFVITDKFRGKLE